MKSRDESLPFIQIAIIIIVAVILLRWLYPKRDVLFTVISLFLAAFVIAYMLNPLVGYLTRNRAPRSLAVLSIFFLIFGGLALLGISLVPSIIDEIQALIDMVPVYSLRFQEYIAELHRDYHRFNLPESVRGVIDESLNDMENTLISLFDNMISKIMSLFESFIILLLLPVLVYYFLRDFDYFKEGVKSSIPSPYRRRVTLLVEEMDITLGVYLRGILLISFLVGLLVYIGLLVLRVEFALLLAIITGMTNLIPFFGPFIGAIPAVFIALLDSPLLALKVVVLIFVIQQVESQLIAPPILGKRLGLHPLLILFVLILGGRLLGLLGLLIAVPLTACLKISYKHLARWHNAI